MEKNKNDRDYGKRKQSGVNKTTVALACIAGFLMIVVIVLMALLMLRGREIPVETLPPTEPTVAMTEAPTEAPTEPVETDPEMLPHMAELYAENPDTFGWVKIGDTKVDYPVMFCPGDQDKYIRADFQGKYDKSGLPYMSTRCSVDPESTTLLVYGHNMRNGTAFRALHNYTDEKFWEENPIVNFSTLYEEREYEIFAVFYDKIYDVDDTHFKHYEFIDPETEEEFDEGIQYFMDNALYDTEIDVEYGDRLLMLVTCSYHTQYGRLVVVGRLVTDEVPAE